MHKEHVTRGFVVIQSKRMTTIVCACTWHPLQQFNEKLVNQGRIPTAHDFSRKKNGYAWFHSIMQHKYQNLLWTLGARVSKGWLLCALALSMELPNSTRIIIQQHVIVDAILFLSCPRPAISQASAVNTSPKIWSLFAEVIGRPSGHHVSVLKHRLRVTEYSTYHNSTSARPQ